MRRFAPFLLFALACAWMALLIAAPLHAAGATVSAATYALGSLICHQRPERSFHLAGWQLPVCARCTGLYAGAAIGAAMSLGQSFRLPLVLSRMYADAARLRVLVLLAALPTLVTWSIEVAGVAQPSNLVRAAAALPLGAAIGAVVLATAGGRLR